MHPFKRKKNSRGGKGPKKSMASMSEEQKNVMLDFISAHPHMIRNRTVGGSSSDGRDTLWDELATILNNCQSGAHKDGAGWRRSWNDMKRYESLKAAEAMSKVNHTSTEDSNAHQGLLSPLQERIANLLGEVLADETRVGATDSTKLKFPILVQESTREASNATTLSVAPHLQSIAEALAERNAIEERKVKVLEKLLYVYAAKKRIQVNDSDSESGESNCF